MNINLSDKSLQEMTDRVNSQPLWDKTQNTPEKTDIFEKIDQSLLKGIPGFKPFYKKLPKDVYKKYDILKISKTYTDCAKQTARETSPEPALQNALAWLLQALSAFEPEQMPEEILKEANIAEQQAIKTGSFLRAFIKYNDLGTFSTIFGNATELSRYMNKCAQMIKIGIDNGVNSSLCKDESIRNRYNTLAQNSSGMISLARQSYPVYEKRILTALS